jgi:hypothetical protein
MSNLGGIIMRSELKMIDLPWLPMDLILFGHPIDSFGPDVTFRILSNETVPMLKDLLE